MTIAAITSDDLREPGREVTQLTKLNACIAAINDASGGGTPGPVTGTTGTFSSTVSASRIGAGDDNPLGDGYIVAARSSIADVLMQIRSSAAGGRSWLLGSGATASAVAPTCFYLYDGTAGALRLSVDPNGKVTLPNALAHTGASVGFYATAPIAKQTGVAVDAAGIHAALVALGLIGA